MTKIYPLNTAVIVDTLQTIYVLNPQDLILILLETEITVYDMLHHKPITTSIYSDITDVAYIHSNNNGYTKLSYIKIN